MAKFLITADLHVHPHKKSNDRLNDCLKALDWVFQTAENKGIKNILMLGDLFHDRQAVPIPAYQKTFDIFRKHLEGRDTKVFVLLGNHDLWHLAKWDISSVLPLDAIYNVRVIDKPSTLEIDDATISFLPFTEDPIKDLAKIKNCSKDRILCGHLAIDGAVLNVMHGTRAEVNIEHDNGMAKVTTDLFSDWNFVFLGHYHAAQKLDFNAEYIGSPLQLSFGEAFQHKHVLIFDSNTHEKEYVRNTFSPQHFIIPEKDIDKYELEGNFIRVIMDNIASSDIIDLRNDLVENHHVGSFDVVQDTKLHEQKQIIEDAKAIILDQAKMVDEYIRQLRETGSLTHLTDAKLNDIWHGILAKAEVK